MILLSKSKIQKRADKLYPIVPLKTRTDEDPSVVVNDGELLENFRLTIQSVSSNMAYVRGYNDATNDWYVTVISVAIGLLIGFFVCVIFF